MYCHHCGKVVQEDMQYCPNCGYPLQNSPYVYHETDAPSFLFALISFFAPLVGLVLYIIWRKDFPQKAKSCMNGMICGHHCRNSCHNLFDELSFTEYNGSDDQYMIDASIEIS